MADAFSQIIINDNMLTGRLTEVRAKVLDSLTNEPVSFASVYVIPAKDTTITNFTLSDAEGEAKLDEVPYGKYTFHVEMMGYKPVVKEKYFRTWRADMGKILLQPDEKFLKAAVISDVGNPVVIKKDTVEFNASSFRVGSNAMLKDLLQRMPGMEITENGKVKFNGEEIDKITIGGRTFFFNDQSTALNNLPASVVDKVRVIDRESESARSSGFQDGSREKILDVGLKKEYEKGWFGNVGLKGGTTISGKEDEPLRDDRGLLYSANALASAYTEKDQVTVVGNAQNVNTSDMTVVMTDENGEVIASSLGISSASQLGMNANTTRVKDIETTLSVNYKYTDTDSGSSSYRTIFQEYGDMNSKTDNSGMQFVNSLATEFEMKKETGSFWFHFRPSFNYRRTDKRDSGESETKVGDEMLNSSGSDSYSLDTNRDSKVTGDVSFRDLWGKKGRIIKVNLDGGYTSGNGSSGEATMLRTLSETDSRNMTYASDKNSYMLAASVRFTEPIGEKWSVSAQGGLHHSHSEQVRDAFDAAGRNDYYSSESRNRYFVQGYELYTQYKMNPQSTITVGGKLNGSLNETFSKSFGIEDTAGEGEWIWFLTPNISFQSMANGRRFNLSASGNSRQPSASRMLPVLNIANPSRLSLGNVYLKPYSSTSLNAYWMKNDMKKFTNLMISAFCMFNRKAITNAQWYDQEGILYMIPVNSRKPSINASIYLSYTTPLDSRKWWFLSAGVSSSMLRSTSYQARGRLQGLDKDTFDYSDFMAGFWGGPDGDRFYGGASGFAESNTTYVVPSANINIRYNRERFSVSAGPMVSSTISRYSLDPSVNMNTLDIRMFSRGTYTTKHNFEFESDLSYVCYKGYSAGYGKPEWQWNSTIAKNIGAFNLSVTVHDILDQTRNLTHTVTANYEEDTYRLVMGRYILFGVKWNFGKMNAAHSQRARRAVWDMAW